MAALKILEMKKLIFALPVFILLASCDAQATKKATLTNPVKTTKSVDASKTSVLVLEYTSICCGPPSEVPVLTYIRDFSKSNKMIKPFVYKKTGLGKEGEFNLYITLNEFTSSNLKTFLSGLQKTVAAQNSARDSSSGYVKLYDNQLNPTEWQRMLDESKNSRFPISTYTY